MQLIVECSCGQRMRVPATRRGKRGKCVNCGAILRIDESTICEATATKTSSVASFESDGQTAPANPVRGEFDGAPTRRIVPEPHLHNPWGKDGEAGQPMPEFTGPPRGRDLWAQRRGVLREEKRDCCVRCGREFRGEWDRHTQDDGVVCNICANLAEHMVAPVAAPRLPDHIVAPPTREELRAIRSLEDAPPAPDPNRYRGLKPFLAVFAVVMLAIFVLPVEEWLAWLSVQELNDEPATLTPLGVRLLWGLVLVFIFIKEWLAVFFGIMMAGGHRDRFFNEAMEAVKYALILSFFSYGSDFIFIGPGGFSLIALCFFLLHALLPLAFLWAFTDFETSYFWPVFIMRFVMTPLMFIVKTLVLGILGVALA